MNEEEIIEKIKPFLDKAIKSMMEISVEVPKDISNSFSFCFAQVALSAFIIHNMDDVSITKDLHELIQDCVNNAIQQSIQIKMKAKGM